MKTPTDIQHPSQEMLLAYVRGELDAATEHRIEKHALDCKACDEIIEGLLLMQEEGILETLVAGKEAAPIRTLPLRRYWSIAASILVLIGLGWLGTTLLPENQQNKVAQKTAPAAEPEKEVASAPETKKEHLSNNNTLKPAPQPEIRAEQNASAPAKREDRSFWAKDKDITVVQDVQGNAVSEAQMEDVAAAPPADIVTMGEKKLMDTMTFNSTRAITLTEDRTVNYYTSPAATPQQTITLKTMSAPQMSVSVEGVKKAKSSYKWTFADKETEESDSMKETRYRATLAKSPKDYDALFSMAELYYNKGNYTTALSYYQQAAAAEKVKDADLLKLKQANCLIKMNRKDEAKVILLQLEKSKYAKDAQKLLKGL